MIRPLTRWIERIRLERACKRHAPIRKARAASAKRGQRTELKRRVERARKLFGELV